MTKQLKLEDRVLLKTTDGKVIVRPTAEQGDYFIGTNIGISLDQRGADAWNNDENFTRFNWTHGLCFDLKILEVIEKWNDIKDKVESGGITKKDLQDTFIMPERKEIEVIA